MTGQPDELLTVEEVAAIVHASPRTVQVHCAAGKLPAVKRLRRWLVRRSDLDKWLTSGPEDKQ